MGAGIQAKSESLGAPVMALITSSVNSSARSVSAAITPLACFGDNVHFVDGEPAGDSCFIVSPISDKAIDVHVDGTGTVGVGACLPDPPTGRFVAPASMGLFNVGPLQSGWNNQNGSIDV
jgi:hypothetical protein